ncbi:hypothetical protein MMM141_11420 [Helicobacter pylori]|uniref:Uncharacterized protein n=1 Tax=Helicobacter pylori UM114 TaxID=1355531 RepID=T0F616_HELPX|nr:hypothetical protein N207_05430 [Helicobacter pylori UM114]
MQKIREFMPKKTIIKARDEQIQAMEEKKQAIERLREAAIT